MPLNFHNLDARTRQFMLEEVDMDIADGRIYLSSYLSDTGRADWPGLLREAARNFNDAWFGDQLRENGRLNATTQRKKTEGRLHNRARTLNSPRNIVGGRIQPLLYPRVMPARY